MSRKIKELLADYTNIITVLLVVTTFSGVLRKWGGLPGMANNLLLLILMVAPIYLLFFFKNEHTKHLSKGLKNLLQIFVFVLAILAVHPLNHTYFHGIFGILMHLVFIAIVLSYFKNKTAFDEKKIVKLFFFALATQLIIGSIQYNAPTDSAINRYADNRQDTPDEITDEEEFVQASAKVGNAVRVTGTFSYLGGFTAIIFFFILFSCYLTKTKKASYLLWLAPIVIYVALLSGSRGTVGFTLILLTAFIFTERRLLVKNPKPIFTTLIVIGILLAVNLAMGDKLGFLEKISAAYENFMLRVEGSEEESKGRLTNDFIQVFTRNFDYRYTGVGLGSTYQGANALLGTSNIVQKTPMEGELFRIIVEGGIFFLLLRWLFLVIIFSYLDIPILLRITLFLFFCVFSQNVFHIYNAIYFSVGLIVLNQAYSKKTSYEETPV